MVVAKLTARDGRIFYTDKLMGHDELRGVAEKAGGLHQVDILDMSEEEYRSIPATSDSAHVFSQD